MNHRTRGRAGVCLMAMVALCAGSTAEDPPGLWLEVPFVKQQAEGCGAAALSMVMQYWSQKDGHPPPPAALADNIFRELHVAEKGGIVASELVRYAEQTGYRAFAFGAEWQDLRTHLGKGRPLIVALRPGPKKERHFAVVVGLARGDQAVLLNDPARGKHQRVSRASFEAQWSAMQNWTLLALPPARP